MLHPINDFTTRADEAMNGQKPWCGPREKSLGFWQMLIEASTLPGNIILDYTAMTSEASSIHFGLRNRFIASIAFRPPLRFHIMLCCFFYAGASIHACRSMGHHIVTLVEDKELFSALLTPMVHSLAVSSLPQPQVAQRSQDPNAMEIVPAKIKKRRASKFVLLVI
jgi:hypothetical protein